MEKNGQPIKEKKGLIVLGVCDAGEIRWHDEPYSVTGRALLPGDVVLCDRTVWKMVGNHNGQRLDSIDVTDRYLAHLDDGYEMARQLDELYDSIREATR